jgi:hypothetical protein
MNDDFYPPLKKQYNELTEDEKKRLHSTYEMLVEMTDRVSSRRQTANSFYLSVNAAIVAATSYINSLGESKLNTAIVALGGIAVAFLWRRNIDSYRDLNSGKFKIIEKIENEMPFNPYNSEWSVLRRGEDKSHYRPFHSVEGLVPYLFLTLHSAQLVRSVPWQTVCEFFQTSALS